MATEIALSPLKSTLKRETDNLNVREAQNYNIVEDFAQAPCAMSALEVLQSCPMQQTSLLAVIGAQDSVESI